MGHIGMDEQRHIDLTESSRGCRLELKETNKEITYGVDYPRRERKFTDKQTRKTPYGKDLDNPRENW